MQPDQIEEMVLPEEGVLKAKPPKWFTYFLYAISGTLILNLLLLAFGLYQTFFDKLPLLISELGAENQAANFSIVVLVFSLILITLELVFAVATIKRKKWTIPIWLLKAVGPLIITFVIFFTDATDMTFGASQIFLSIGLPLVIIVLFLYFKDTFIGSWRKLSIQIVLSLVLIPTILFQTLWILFPDDTEVNDADLLLPDVPVLAEDQNAYYKLISLDSLSEEQEKAMAEVGEMVLALTNEEEISLEDARQTVDTLSPLIAVAEEAVSYDFQCPTSVNQYSFEAELCSLKKYRNLAQLLVLQTYVDARFGDAKKSLESAELGVAYGKMLMDATHTTLIEYLVAEVSLGYGLDGVEYHLAFTGNSSTTDQYQEILDDLVELQQSGAQLATMHKAEYMGIKEAIERLRPAESYLFQPNKTLNEVAYVMRSNVEVANASCDDDYSAVGEEMDRYIVKQREEILSFKNILLPNTIGKLQNSVVLASLSGVKDKECVLQERIESVTRSLESKISITDGNSEQQFNGS